MASLGPNELSGVFHHVVSSRLKQLRTRATYFDIWHKTLGHNSHILGLLPVLASQQEQTKTTRTLAFWGNPPPPHDYPYYWVILDPKSKEDKVKVTDLKNLPKFQSFQFWHNFYTRHTFWRCFIRCANMKWIWQVLFKIQSWHDSVHRRTRWNQYTPFQLRWSGGYNYIISIQFSTKK